MKPIYFNSDYSAVDGRTNTVVMTQVIKGFPYPERFCVYCEQELSVENAFHAPGNEEVFKCLYQCLNTDCGAYDEEGNMSYVRVYYSCTLAYELYESLFLKIKRELKQ
jgi:hypothetical protein